MTSTHPVAARYLAELERGLSAIDPAERAEIVREIANHIADAQAAGRPLEEVLQVLGPAGALARAYAVETILNPKTPQSHWDRTLTLIGFFAIASLPSFVLIVTLGAVGFAFVVAGVAAIGAALASFAGFVDIMDTPPGYALAVGPFLLAGGIAALTALVYYVRFLARLARRTLARTRT